MPEDLQKPTGFESDLGPLQACFFDSWCGEPISWGFKLLSQLDEKRLEKLRPFGKLECDPSGSIWYLIVRKITRAEAIDKYGQITHEDFGFNGPGKYATFGWKSTTFGTTRFLSRQVAPSRDELQEAMASPVAVVEIRKKKKYTDQRKPKKKK